jgi:hypothetical protein
MSVYPTNIVTLPTWQDEIDVVAASIVNTFRDEVIALQTYVGTNPHGNTTSLNERVTVCIGTDGALRKGSAFPTNPKDGQTFWKTSEPAFYVYSSLTGTWQAPTVLSNLAFEYHGIYSTSCEVESSSLVATGPMTYRYLANPSASAFTTMWTGKLKKIAGMTNVSVKSRIWLRTGAGSANIHIGIGSAFGTATGSAGSTNPEEVTVSVDISGLSNGTFYDVVAQTKDTASGSISYIGSLIGIVS